MNESIGKVIVKAIRMGKWLYITYASAGDVKKYFWIAIEDIEFGSDDIRLIVSMYNPDKNIDSALPGKLYFSKILTAKILDFTEYDVTELLLKNTMGSDPNVLFHLSHNIFTDAGYAGYLPYATSIIAYSLYYSIPIFFRVCLNFLGIFDIAFIGNKIADCIITYSDIGLTIIV